jgi:hypothetical protein
MKILLVGKISERQSISVFLVQTESVSPLVLTPHHIVQSDRSGDRDSADDESHS